MRAEIPTKILIGDCREVLKTLPDESVDSVVTDPPYELGFMGKSWDSTGIAYDVELWREVLRVIKPGGHLLAFGGSRTYHRMACAIEDAGFEIRDQIMWIYGSGFPKSLNVGKAIDKAAGIDRPVEGYKNSDRPNVVGKKGGSMSGEYTRRPITSPQTEQSKEWDGWGTALKPAHEPICLARKPLSEKTVAANVLKWGTGALNIDDSRVSVEDAEYQKNCSGDRGHAGTREEGLSTNMTPGGGSANNSGRFPANLILDEEAGKMVDEQSGIRKSGEMKGFYKGITKAKSVCFGEFKHAERNIKANSGGASRFFYCSKASRKDRGQDNNHPTVKPIRLMEYLVRLVTPSKGLVLDPFAGSGTTCLAALRLGFKTIGIEANPEYAEIFASRLKSETDQGLLF